MSRENVEIVRALHETAGGHLDAGVDFMAPDIELHLTGVFPDLDPVYRGHEGVQQFVAVFNVPWTKLAVEVERYIDLAEQVLSLSYFEGTGRDGIEARLPLAHLWTLRDGLVTRMDAFSDHDDALEAVGLSG
jgi:ketosteroid isomerase-like protein